MKFCYGQMCIRVGMLMAKVKFLFTLVLSVQSLAAAAAAAAKITLSTNWTVTNNATEEYSIVGHAKFSYFLSGGTKIQNQNETFSLGFVRQEGSSLYTLSIIMTGQNSETGEIGMQVWSANRDNLVRTGATLSINENRTLQLLDSDKTLAWSPQTQQIASMELLDTGNLVLYDSKNNTLWQSFEHPTNVILPGQNLTLGMRLVSNFSSSNVSSGYSSMVMEENGLTFYDNLNVPYNMWSFWGRNKKATNPRCSLYQAVLVYNTSGAFLQPVNNTGINRNDSQVCRPMHLTNWTYDDSAFGLVCSQTCRRFIRLESDGNLGSYIYFDNSKRWRAPYYIFSTCQLPNPCGSYGVCSTASQCTCPNPDGKSWISLINSSNPTEGCIAKKGLDCSSTSQRMLEATGINYISNSFLEALQGIQNLKSCTSSCLSNCSCKAAFFINSTHSCYHVADVRTMYQSGNSSDLAFLKVQNEKKTKNYVILGLTIGFTLLSLLICMMIWIKIRNKREKMKAALAEEDLLKGLPGLPPRFSFRDLHKATKSFSKKLGSGAFGAVYEGTLKDGKPVAVKKLESSMYVMKQLVAEVATLGSISHVNLVRLCGFCLDRMHHLLVYELLPNSSLDKWLFREDRRPLNWDTRFRIALGTARGLAYLHEECRDPIIHLDIKPQNILLDHDFTAKVADFGLAKLISRDRSLLVTSIGGTPGYIAPEAILHSIVTKRCDAYSYGVVLLELVGGRRHFRSEMENSEEIYLPRWAALNIKEGRVEAVVDPRLDGMFNKREAHLVLQVALLCIQDDPSARPLMGEVVKMLEGHVGVPDLPASLQSQLQTHASNAAKALVESLDSQKQGSFSPYFSSSPTSCLLQNVA